jgi:hypothetical protein
MRINKIIIGLTILSITLAPLSYGDDKKENKSDSERTPNNEDKSKEEGNSVKESYDKADKLNNNCESGYFGQLKGDCKNQNLGN